MRLRVACTASILAFAMTAGAQVPTPPPGAPPTVPSAGEVDSTTRALVRRAQRLVTDGQGAEGRALIDSMLNAAAPASALEAEVLYWRAVLAENWDSAQRDYLRLMLEHERSPRAGDAMLRLAQGEVTRGDREAAVRYLERLVREAPESPARTEGDLWRGRLLIERGDAANGCAALRDGRARLAESAIEMINQFDYLMQGCRAATASSVPPPSTPATAPAPPSPARDTTTRSTAPPPPSTPPSTLPTTPPTTLPSTPAAAPARAPAAAPAGRWSVQVAALATRAEADAFVERLKERGYDARVDATAAPFRVRFGRYATREQASAAAAAYKSKEQADAFIVEVPRG